MFNTKKIINVASTLEVKTLESIDDTVAEDLNQPEGKSIAELLNDQKKSEETPSQCE